MAHSFSNVFEHINGLEDLQSAKFSRIGSGIYEFKSEAGQPKAIVKIKGTDPLNAKSEYKLLKDIQSGYPVEYKEIDRSGFIAMPSFEEVDLEQQARNAGISEDKLNKIKENYLLKVPIDDPAPKEENYFVKICQKGQLEVQTLKNLYLKGFYNFDFKPNNIMLRDEQFVLIDLDSCTNIELFRIDNIAITDGHCFRAKNGRGYDLFDNIEAVNALSSDILDKVAQMTQWDNLIHCIARMLFSDKITQGRYLNPLSGIGYSDFSNSFSISKELPPVLPSSLPLSLEGWYDFFQNNFVLNLDSYKSDQYLPFVRCFTDFLTQIREKGLRWIADGRDFNNVINSLSHYLYFMEYLLQKNDGELFKDACGMGVVDASILISELKKPIIKNKIDLMRLGFGVDILESSSDDSEDLSLSLIEEMSPYWGEDNQGGIGLEIDSNFSVNRRIDSSIDSSSNDDLEEKLFTENFMQLWQRLSSHEDVRFILNSLDSCVGMGNGHKKTLFLLILGYIDLRITNVDLSHEVACEQAYESLHILDPNNQYFRADVWQRLKGKMQIITADLYSSSSQFRRSWLGSEVLGSVRQFFKRIYNWFLHNVFKRGEAASQADRSASGSSTFFAARTKRRQTISLFSQNPFFYRTMRDQSEAELR